VDLILLNPDFVYSNRVKEVEMDAVPSDPNLNMLSEIRYAFDIWYENNGSEDAITREERIERTMEYLIAGLHDGLTLCTW
jgi:hypothetical protein